VCHCKATANTHSLLNSDKTCWGLARGHNVPGGANQLPEWDFSRQLALAVITQQSKSSLEIPDTESQNHVGWKRLLRSLSPNVKLALPSPPINHVPKHHIYTFFKQLHG